MAIENGEWIMRGLDWYDPARIQSWDELIEWIDEIGFLPLFKNEVDGFSVEENTADLYWWSGDEAQDPWEWRCLMARSGKVAYGKFFGKKAGFISKAWFPHFANWRRDGYDFDSRWEDELAPMRQKRIMDCFAGQDEWFSFALKQRAGFGKGGTWSGSLDNLQHEYSPLFVFDDGSEGARALCARGATPVQSLTSLQAPTPAQLSFDMQ